MTVQHGDSQRARVLINGIHANTGGGQILQKRCAKPAGANSVTDFTRRVKALLEGNIRPCWVRGEVSNVRVQSSGHVYFSLKDAGAQLSAVLFRGDAARQTFALRDGLQVVALGEISVYEPHGKYQFKVRTVVDDGVGRLQREFEALKARLPLWEHLETRVASVIWAGLKG